MIHVAVDYSTGRIEACAPEDAETDWGPVLTTAWNVLYALNQHLPGHTFICLDVIDATARLC